MARWFADLIGWPYFGQDPRNYTVSSFDTFLYEISAVLVCVLAVIVVCCVFYLVSFLYKAIKRI